MVNLSYFIKENKMYSKYLKINSHTDFLFKKRMLSYRFVLRRFFFFSFTLYIFNKLFNPIGFLKNFYTSKFKQLVSEIFGSKEVIDTSLKLVENLFKEKNLIDIQLNQLKLAFKSELVIDNSKIFGKNWIIKVIKSEKFIDFSKSYFTQIIKREEFTSKSGDLCGKAIENKDLQEQLTQVCKVSILNYTDTFNALISGLNKAGMAAIKNDEFNQSFGKMCSEITTNEKFLREIKKISLPFFFN